MGVSHLFVMQFLSTPSARRATPLRRYCKKTKRISIHALREEGDLKIVSDMVTELISIHALREEGDNSPVTGSSARSKFLSTPSARRATKQQSDR